MSLLPQHRPSSPGCGYPRLPFGGIPQGFQPDEASAGHPALLCAVAQPLMWHLEGGVAAGPAAAPIPVPACGSVAFPWSSAEPGGFSPSHGNAAWLWLPGTGSEIEILHPLQARFMAFFPLLLPSILTGGGGLHSCDEMYPFSLESSEEIPILPRNVYIFWPKLCIFCSQTPTSRARCSDICQ